MVAEYTLFHGVALVQLVARRASGVHIRDLTADGRPSSYFVDERIGLYLKHSSARLRPWQFTFTRANLDVLSTLAAEAESVHVALVCQRDGVMCLSLPDLQHCLGQDHHSAEQISLRVDRRKGKWYTISGPGLKKPAKRPKGLDSLLSDLARSKL